MGIGWVVFGLGTGFEASAAEPGFDFMVERQQQLTANQLRKACEKAEGYVSDLPGGEYDAIVDFCGALRLLRGDGTMIKADGQPVELPDPLPTLDQVEGFLRWRPSSGPPGFDSGGPTFESGLVNRLVNSEVGDSPVAQGATAFLLERTEDELTTWFVDTLGKVVCPVEWLADRKGLEDSSAETLFAPFPRACALMVSDTTLISTAGVELLRDALRVDLTSLPRRAAAFSLVDEPGNDPLIAMAATSRMVELVLAGAKAQEALAAWSGSASASELSLTCSDRPIASVLYTISAVTALAPDAAADYNPTHLAATARYTFGAALVRGRSGGGWPECTLPGRTNEATTWHLVSRSVSLMSSLSELENKLRQASSDEEGRRAAVGRLVVAMAGAGAQAARLAGEFDADVDQAVRTFETLSAAGGALARGDYADLGQHLLVVFSDLELDVLFRSLKTARRDIGVVKAQLGLEAAETSQQARRQGRLDNAEQAVVDAEETEERKGRSPISAVRAMTFAGSLGNAESAEEASAVIESVVAPPGGWRRKRSGQGRSFHVGLNGYVGAGAGFAATADDLSERSGAAWATVMVGPELSWALAPQAKQSASLGVFVSVVDLGALATLRFDDTDDSDATSRVRLGQLLAPGGHVVFGIPGAPFSLYAGGSYTPGLRLEEIEGRSELVPGVRIGAGVAVDLVLLP